MEMRQSVSHHEKFVKAQEALLAGKPDKVLQLVEVLEQYYPPGELPAQIKGLEIAAIVLRGSNISPDPDSEEFFEAVMYLDDAVDVMEARNRSLDGMFIGFKRREILIGAAAVWRSTHRLITEHITPED